MPQENRPRGRPRTFDADAVLAIAQDAFWRRGLAGVSLDEVSAATGVARPGLAAAFGDKRALYLRTIDAFTAQMDVAARTLMGGSRPLRVELGAFFTGAVDLYLAGDEPRGCMALCTLPVEAADDPEIRVRLGAVLNRTDALLQARFQLARARGELPARTNIAGRGALAAALLHSVAIRARAGAGRATLLAMIRAALPLLCRAD